MTYNDHVSELARTLARLVAARQLAPPVADLPLVAAYRSDVVDALDRLHRRLFPVAARQADRDRARDIEQEPVRALGTLLAQHPRSAPAALSPSERLELAPQTWAARQWRDAAQHALLAVDAASRLEDGWDADPATAWQAAADLADIAEAFAVADTDLVTACAAHPDLAGALPPAAAYAGLRVAAAECAQLARRGPLTHLDAPHTGPPAPMQPMVVRGPADLAEGQQRLAHLLRDPDRCLAPELLSVVAAGQARAHLSAERILHAAAEPDSVHAADYREAASALRARANSFAEIADSSGQVRGLHRGPLGPTHQTGEIMRALRRVDETLTTERGAAVAPYVLAWAARGELVLRAIDELTRQAVHTGDYLVPNNHHSRRSDVSSWVPAPMSDPPQLLDDVSLAVERERAISAAIDHVLNRTSGTGAAAAARASGAADELRAALASRPAARPTRPGDPVYQVPPARTAAPPGPFVETSDLHRLQGTATDTVHVRLAANAPEQDPQQRWAALGTDVAGQRVVDDPGWPGLAAALSRADAAGWDVEANLHRLVAWAEMSDRQPARELHYRLMDDCPDVRPPAPAVPADVEVPPAVTGQARLRAEMATQQQPPDVGRDALGR